MIKTLADKETQKVFRRQYSKKLPEETYRSALVISSWPLTTHKMCATFAILQGTASKS